MGKLNLSATTFVLLWVTIGIGSGAEARILAQCDAVKELDRGGVPRTLISNFVCLMQSESGMNTSLVTGPKTMSSYSFGVFQINSLEWCKRGRKGGKCQKACEDFANDDIKDDVVCAKLILEQKGFQWWTGWMKKCKDKPLPNIGQCKRRRSLESRIEQRGTLENLRAIVMHNENEKKEA